MHCNYEHGSVETLVPSLAVLQLLLYVLFMGDAQRLFDEL